LTATPQERELAALQHMVQAAEAIQSYTKGGKARFLSNRMAQDAVMRQLELLGEAARRVPEAFRQENPQLPWRSLASLRSVLAHGDGGVDLEKAWDAVAITVNQALPLLRQWLLD
jgi:uncharacterized protein with HEPN domain